MSTSLTLLKVTVTSGTGGSSTSQSYFFKGTKGLYVGEIATATGVAEASAAESGNPATSVSQLIHKNVLQRLNVRSKEGTKTFLTKMVCSVAESGLIAGALKDKIIQSTGAASSGSVISSVATPMKSQFY